MSYSLFNTGGLFNNFDGSAELLDDLNDHCMFYSFSPLNLDCSFRELSGCAGAHKRERNAFIKRLQDFAMKKQIRVTILGGDVHLAAVGRFFSKEKFKIPQVSDF